MDSPEATSSFDGGATLTLKIPAALLVAALAQAAAAEISARIAELSLEELGQRWGCTNRRETLRKCGKRGVPVRYERGRKSAYVLLADVEAANARMRPAEQLTDGVRVIAMTHPPRPQPQRNPQAERTAA